MEHAQLEWDAGRRRLPFFNQRLAVALLDLLVVSLALVGATVILWSGSQRPERPLGPARAPQPQRAHDLLYAKRTFSSNASTENGEDPSGNMRRPSSIGGAVAPGEVALEAPFSPHTTRMAT